jgi:hypothetical protein
MTITILLYPMRYVIFRIYVFLQDKFIKSDYSVLGKENINFGHSKNVDRYLKMIEN